MILLYSIIIFFVNSLLVLTTNINIYPEFFVFPWLVRLGYLPYRDFFDQHGFLLYYILAPFTADKSLTSIKIIYFLFQTLNLAILLIILRRITHRASFVLGGLMYVLMSYYTSENNFWYEIPIALIYSLLYLFTIIKPFREKLLITALFASAASMIKPTAAMILVPLFYIYKSTKLFLYFSLSWIIVGIIFLYQHGLSNLIDNLFLFNRHYATYFSEHRVVFINLRFAKISLLFFLFCFIVVLLQKKIKPATNILLFVFTSSIFLFPIFATYNLAPLCLFFTIFVAFTIKVSQKWWRYSVYLVLLFYIFVLLGYSNNRVAVNTARIAYIEQEATNRIIALSKNISMTDKKMFVLGTQVELYYLLENKPSTYFPFIVPWLTLYYPTLEQQLIDEIKMNNVEIVLVPQPLDNYYSGFYALRDIITENFFLAVSSPDVQIFIKN
mgnify:CR=1 FL=1